MVWSDWWGFWAFGLGDSGTLCGIRFALPRPPRFAKGTVGEGRFGRGWEVYGWCAWRRFGWGWACRIVTTPSQRVGP